MSEVTDVNDVILQTRYGIAETFTSWQGEGLYTGTRMHFVRFSGCSVGKKLTEEQREKWAKKVFQSATVDLTPLLPMYMEQCTLYDGRQFLCDTNFQTSKAMSLKQILDEIPKGVERICLTGGEPLDRKLGPLLDYVGRETGYKVHIETSGTKSLKEAWPGYELPDSVGDDDSTWIWVTVAPKLGVLPEMIELANEIKLLVDETFDINQVPMNILAHELVWLQPVNKEWDVDMENVKRCLKILEEHPKWRLSLQQHKIAKVR